MSNEIFLIVQMVAILWGFCAMVDLGIALFVLWLNHVWKQRRP